MKDRVFHAFSIDRAHRNIARVPIGTDERPSAFDRPTDPARGTSAPAAPNCRTPALRRPTLRRPTLRRPTLRREGRGVPLAPPRGRGPSSFDRARGMVTAEPGRKITTGASRPAAGRSTSDTARRLGPAGADTPRSHPTTVLPDQPIANRGAPTVRCPRAVRPSAIGGRTGSGRGLRLGRQPELRGDLFLGGHQAEHGVGGLVVAVSIGHLAGRAMAVPLVDPAECISTGHEDAER